MKPNRTLARFEKSFGTWDAALQRRTDDDFARSLECSTWTLGEVCDHVAFVSEFFLKQIEPLANGEGLRKKASMAGRFIFFVGSFPPVRIKVPKLPPELDRIAAPRPSGRADAQKRFTAIAAETRRLRTIAANADPGLRSEHPVAGFVNAVQWYQLSEMHMRHHLRQLRRIEKELGGSF